MISAQSSDGVVHQFPDGTAPEVVDKVMKDYATTKSPQPLQSNQPDQASQDVSQPKNVLDAIWNHVKDYGSGLSEGYKAHRQMMDDYSQYLKDALSGKIPDEEILSNARDPNSLFSRAGSSLALGFAGPDMQAVGASTALAPVTQQAAALTPKQQVASDSIKSGYKIPPSEANPGVVNDVATSLAGRPPTEQLAAFKNQPVTNALVKADLGLPEEASITPAALHDIRTEAGKAYENIKTLPQRFKIDPQFSQDVDGLGGSYASASKEFPNLVINKDIDALKNELTSITSGEGKEAISIPRTDVSPAAAIELSKKLRFDASKNFLSEDPTKIQLAMAQKQGAKAVEDLVSRNLDSTGQSDLLDQFLQAREKIAKTYTYEGALNQSTGDINAVNLARQLKSGAPLTGNAEKIAQFAQAFPYAAKEGIRGRPGLSFGDLALGTGFGLATGGSGTATALARPLLREALLTHAYQTFMAAPHTAEGAMALQQMLALMAAKASQSGSPSYDAESEKQNKTSP